MISKSHILLFGYGFVSTFLADSRIKILILLFYAGLPKDAPLIFDNGNKKVYRFKNKPVLRLKNHNTVVRVRHSVNVNADKEKKHNTVY